MSGVLAAAGRSPIPPWLLWLLSLELLALPWASGLGEGRYMKTFLSFETIKFYGLPWCLSW